MAKKNGRPSLYTKELADLVCERLSMGESLRTVCKSKDMPSPATIFKWMREEEGFLKQYEKAKQESTDAMAEDILDIADDLEGDFLQTEDGRTVANGVSVQRDRLRVDTRKWLMSKMKPKKYGEKLDIEQKSEVVHKYEEMDDDQLNAVIKARKDRLSEDA